MSSEGHVIKKYHIWLLTAMLIWNGINIDMEFFVIFGIKLCPLLESIYNSSVNGTRTKVYLPLSVTF